LIIALIAESRISERSSKMICEIGNRRRYPACRIFVVLVFTLLDGLAGSISLPLVISRKETRTIGSPSRTTDGFKHMASVRHGLRGGTAANFNVGFLEPSPDMRRGDGPNRKTVRGLQEFNATANGTVTNETQNPLSITISRRDVVLKLSLMYLDTETIQQFQLEVSIANSFLSTENGVTATPLVEHFCNSVATQVNVHVSVCQFA
jgi:hypothetical protein